MTHAARKAARLDERSKMLLGWPIILVCSLLIYDALLFSSIRRETWRQTLASARIAADNLRLKLAVGMRLGKTPEKYRGLDALVRFASDAAQRPMAVLDTGGRIIFAHGGFPGQAFGAGELLSDTDGILLREDPQGRSLFLPVAGRDGAAAAYIGVRMARAPLEAELWSVFGRQPAAQGVFSAAGLLLLAILLRPGCGRRRLSPRFCCLAVFSAVMLAGGTLALYTAGTRYTDALLRDAGRTGALLTRDLQRLAQAGVTLERMSSVDAYLADIEAAHNGAVALTITDPQGCRVAGNDTAKTALPDASLIFALGDAGQLVVSLVREPWLKHLRALALDMLTMTVVAFIFMLELFLLLTRSTALPSDGPPAPRSPDMRSGILMRPLAFFMLFAMDMSISFIPLRMAEFVPPDHPELDILLGLPISAEMGLTGLGVLLAGVWIQRQGTRSPLETGLLLICLGCFGSMWAAAPWQFVLARTLVGFGYGLALLTAQACTVRTGLLADMFAGVYAGSLCGSALGAMLAEHFGYTSVFLLSALVLLCLLPLPLIFLPGGHGAEDADADSRPGFRQMLTLLTDRRFVAFSLLSLVPSAMLCVGFLNYLLPVYLKGTGAAQSDIGRIYMLNCLLVIYSGPPLTRLVLRTRSPAFMVCLAGIVAAAGLLAPAVLPPLPAILLGAVLIGLATGLNIPAQSEYLLQLESARAVGIGGSMGLLDALQRVGQVLGPLGAGAVLMFMSVDRAALLLGVGLILISLLFPLLGRAPRRAADGEVA